MSEVAEIYAGMKQASQERRAANRENSAELLMAAGVKFDSKNVGAHLIVSHAGHTYDFWPGTGLWKMRGSPKSHRGVRWLFAQLGVAMPVLADEAQEPEHA